MFLVLQGSVAEWPDVAKLLSFGLLFSSLAKNYELFGCLAAFWATFTTFLCYRIISFLVIWQKFVQSLAKFGPNHLVTLPVCRKPRMTGAKGNRDWRGETRIPGNGTERNKQKIQRQTEFRLTLRVHPFHVFAQPMSLYICPPTYSLSLSLSLSHPLTHSQTQTHPQKDKDSLLPIHAFILTAAAVFSSNAKTTVFIKNCFKLEVMTAYPAFFYLFW